MRILFILLNIISISTASADLSEGMVETLPLNHIQENDYLGFENFRTRPRAPIAGGIMVNGERPRSMDDIFKTFSEEVAAFIPEGKTIRESKNDAGLLVWRYPIGTRVIHQINFRDDQESLFELRMIERMESNRWAFGVYHPKEGKLKLQHYKGSRDEEYNLRYSDGSPMNVKLHHIPLHVCQRCHNRTTSAPHQYNEPKDVGPCEFTPTNPKVQVEWVNNYIKAFGRTPVTR